MDSPPLDNATDFIAVPQTLVDKDGERLTVIVKATYELLPLGGGLEIAPKDRRRGIRTKDIPWGKPEVSSIFLPSDLCLRKPATDILVTARAYAPGGVAVPTLDVAVRVGTVQKLVKVFGLRVWQGGGMGLSSPRTLQYIDMRYDYAWGGVDDSDPAKFLEEARNPVGLGVTRDGNALTHKPAPSIEDPANLLITHKTRPPPAGLGPIGRHWEPRRKFAGTWDDAWLEERAPLPPLDFDDRFNQCASPGLIADPPLRGGEEVSLLNLLEGGGATSFFLPTAAPELEFEVKGRPTERFTPHLDTLVIDAWPRVPKLPRELTVELVWRASVAAPRRAKDARVGVYERSLGERRNVGAK